MDSIVEHGLKIDLHIHSCASAPKDGSKVKNNTVENIPLLVSKLNENGVNICAITDHDTFSLEMYSELKKAELDTSSIKKVLPGVEFSVSFLDHEKREQVIHVVTIFSDKEGDKIPIIETVLQKYRPESSGAYTEESFLKVLREIDLDTILVAHQKNTLSSKKPRKNDVNSLGETKFLELVASDYFEAYEFKNKRNEVLNKDYLLTKGIDDKVRFVTGTDCHDWSVYPKEDPSDTTTDFPYTFAKCLPTFRGLVMALTDQQRLKRVDSFFTADKTTLEYIEIENNGKTERIPLSKGINVIIGDNSVGKSMLLHALSGFEKPGENLSKSLKDGYKAYLKKKNLKIKKQLKKENVFAFDMQGEVRRKFEQNLLVASEFSNYFPPNVNTQVNFLSNTVQDYSFVSRLTVKEINAQFFMQHVNSLFKSNTRVDLNTITESRLKESLLKYDGTPVLQFFREALIKSFEDDFAPKQTIILRESDKTEELSAGLNAKIYFDLLSYENSMDGVYIIDQPEDNVSQPAIKEYLLDCFRAMGENRQVIMVSHNPQFIVNLDVDNIIYLFCGDDGKLRFQSGALEYECADYSVLQLVADNIDGGLDSIQKRWKRYEKNNRI